MEGNFLIDPIDFMKKNVVVPNHSAIGITQLDAGIHTLCLVKSTVPARKHGKNIDKWVLTKYFSRLNTASLGGIFQAYWCPYNRNETFTCMLGTDSRYMFTATMDGCSFGIGSQTGGGGCLVGHSNEASFGAGHEDTFGTDGARQFQRLEQGNRLKHALGNNVKVISPFDYMSDYDGSLELKSTTFGYRKGTRWHFYTQQYWKNGSTYFLRDVVER